jgi:hypothetical protein
MLYTALDMLTADGPRRRESSRAGPEGEHCMTPLERRYGWLLRAYPAWYRRERAGEMLDTLLAASPPGRRWPSSRDTRALVTGGLRVRGFLLLCLSILWAVLGALGAGYNFILSAHVPQASFLGIQPWVGEPAWIYNAADLGALAWLLLTIPVLIAGLVRLSRTNSDLMAAWAILWVAGIALIIQVASWHPNATAIISGNCWQGSGCVLAGYRHAVLSRGELAVVAAWLALGAAMTFMVARTARLRARYVVDGRLKGT